MRNVIVLLNPKHINPDKSDFTFELRRWLFLRQKASIKITYQPKYDKTYHLLTQGSVKYLSIFLMDKNL